MRAYATPVSPAEQAARDALSAANARLHEILAVVRMSVDERIEVGTLVQRIAQHASDARSELIYSIRRENERIARGACDACGNHGEIVGFDANGGTFTEPCVRCA